MFSGFDTRPILASPWRLFLRSLLETPVPAQIVSGILTADLGLGTVFNFTNNANITGVNLLRRPAGKVVAPLFCMTANGTAYTQAWTGGNVSVSWPSNSPPTLTTATGKRDLFTLLNPAGDGNFIGAIGPQNS